MFKQESIEGYPDLKIHTYEVTKDLLKLNNWFESCLADIKWTEGTIKIFGKEHKIPRLQAWYADQNINYSYSGKKLVRNNWNNVLKEIKCNVELITSVRFNSVLGNLYRNGSDSMGLHSDDEKELGDEPVIASFSLGEERDIFFKHKIRDIKFSIPQENGKLIVMSGATQQYWKHEVKKTKKFKKPRINLTFRNIITP
jgi:alkylated DNA repair dioxygenase AlkB